MNAQRSAAEPIGPRMLAIRRTLVIIVAVAAVTAGVIALIWTTTTLLAVTFLFGVFLLVAGIARIGNAFDYRKVSTVGFVVNVVVGLSLLIVGIVCLNNLARSLVVVAVLVGVSWIAGGVADLVVAGLGMGTGRRGFVVMSGGVSIVAGIVMLFLPVVTLGVFVKIAAILLIIIGVAALATLPRSEAGGAVASH